MTKDRYKSIKRLIRASFVMSRRIYDSVQALLVLRVAGAAWSKHRILHLMRETNFRAMHGYRNRRVTATKPSVLIASVRNLQLTVTRRKKAWVT